MSGKDEKLTKVGINWLVTLFATLFRNTYKIRLCEY